MLGLQGWRQEDKIGLQAGKCENFLILFHSKIFFILTQNSFLINLRNDLGFSADVWILFYDLGDGCFMQKSKQ